VNRRVRNRTHGGVGAGGGQLPPATRSSWQGRLLVSSAGQIYDFRNRFWSAELGAFITPDEFEFVTREGTLWSWPGQNPLANADRLGGKCQRV
jgi:hypothetical protein